jgi:hypothetical protein
MDALAARRHGARFAVCSDGRVQSGLFRALKRAVLAALLCVAFARDAGAAKGPIRWIADDWPRAAAEARRRDALLVVDAWAPW